MALAVRQQPGGNKYLFSKITIFLRGPTAFFQATEKGEHPATRICSCSPAHPVQACRARPSGRLLGAFFREKILDSPQGIRNRIVGLLKRKSGRDGEI